MAGSEVMGGAQPWEAAKKRCAAYRRRILDVSQRVTALHIGGAFSSTEILDICFNGLMRRREDKTSPDTFVLSKGHGCMILYVVLESLGILKKSDVDGFCTSEGILGVHPDYGNPGIAASTGALGHGLSMAVGMAYGEAAQGGDGNVYCVVSDGELQEGSTWEAVLMASSLKVANLVAFVDNNDFQSLGRTSVTHPSFYPLVDKFTAFGWACVELDGHDSRALYEAVKHRPADKPLMVVCKTIKGKGVSYMEDQPIWHYRSPNPEEYRQALREIEESSR